MQAIVTPGKYYLADFNLGEIKHQAMFDTHYFKIVTVLHVLRVTYMHTVRTVHKIFEKEFLLQIFILIV